MKAFPILLTFGREYNGTGSVVPTIGKYDFGESRGSTFWNRTYTLIARACPEMAHLKQRCIGLDSSPLVFSNVFPKSIPNQVTTKDAIRADISRSLISDHLRQVFALPIIQRVQVVLLSVGPVPNFPFVRDLVTSQCRSRNVHLINLPYLGARSSNRGVDEALSDDDRSAIRRIVSQFFASTNEG